MSSVHVYTGPVNLILGIVFAVFTIGNIYAMIVDVTTHGGLGNIFSFIFAFCLLILLPLCCAYYFLNNVFVINRPSFKHDFGIFHDASCQLKKNTALLKKYKKDYSHCFNLEQTVKQSRKAYYAENADVLNSYDIAQQSLKKAQDSFAELQQEYQLLYNTAKEFETIC